MKKILLMLVLALAMVGYAQEGSLKPKFQAFSGGLIKLKPADKGFHKFSIKVEGAAPWSFQAIGEVRAPNGDPDLLIKALFEGDVYAVLAYVDQTTSGSDGQEYNAGLFEMMLYYDDEPTTIRNLKFKLLPPADDDWAQGILKDALESGSLMGQIWKGKYESAITKASANPIDKSKLKAMSGKKKTNVESDDSGSKKKKRIMHDDEDDCDNPRLSAKEKKRCRMMKK